MTVVVRARIEAQEPGLIGRESERAALRLVLGRDGPAVVFVHGIGGVGKSALLETFMSDARAEGAVVVSLDGGAVEPTPRGFLAALSSATGSDLESAEDAVARLARLGSLVVLDRGPVRGPAADRPRGSSRTSCRPCRTTCGWWSRAASRRWRAGRWRWAGGSAASRWATCRAPRPRSSCAGTASPATTSSASTGWREAIPCRSGWRRPRSSPSRPATTTRRRSRRSWTSSPSCTWRGSIRRRARPSMRRRSSAGPRSRCSRRCSRMPRRRTPSTGFEASPSST